MTLEIVLLVACIVGSAFASASEIALVSASRIRLQHLAVKGVRAAGRALPLLETKEQILAATLVVNNLCNISAGAITTFALERRIGSLGPLAATISVASILLLFAEIVPKTYYRHHAERLLLLSAPIWKVLSWALLPITLVTQAFATLLFRVFGKPPRSVFTTREEIKLVVEEAVEQGGLREHEHEMLESALDYADTLTREVMVPISEVVLIPETASTEELIEATRNAGYTRLPVYRDRVDRIVGLVNIFDVLYDADRKPSARDYMRPARLVPDTKRIDLLFLEMQRERESLAIVVNEFGACIGIVALEDIIEEIFGELTDEHETGAPEIRKLGPGRYRVSARVDIDDLNDETGLDLAKAGFETVGGYVLHRMGRIPRRGDTFTDGAIAVRVLDADRYGVRAVEIAIHGPGL
jgi:CBS domain containing-hemolysin-like protein